VGKLMATFIVAAMLLKLVLDARWLPGGEADCL
jgi:hypothetical protein